MRRSLIAGLVVALLASGARATDSLLCATYTNKETRALGLRGGHLVFCVNLLTGQTLGSVLSPAGVERCAVTGGYDFGTGCLTLNACGRTLPLCPK